MSFIDAIFPGFIKSKQRWGRLFLAAVYGVPNVFLWVLTKIMWLRGKHKEVRNICIHRVGNIGDIVCSIPAMISIREIYPNAKITLLTSAGRKGGLGALQLLKGAWYLDEIINYYEDEYKGKRLISLIKRLRAQRFDLWILLPRELQSFISLIKAAVVARFVSSKKACGFVFSTNFVFRKCQFKNFIFSDEVSRLKYILRSENLWMEGKYENLLPVSAKDRTQAKYFMSFAKKGLVPIFVFIVDAKRPHNVWPKHHFAKLANIIIREYESAYILLIGGTDAVNIGLSITQAVCHPSLIDLTGKTSLEVASELLKFADVVVSNNTGFLHISAMQNIPTIGIFSSAEYIGKWYPHGDKAHVLLNEKINCAGCYFKVKCDYKCIKSIEPEKVFDLVTRIVNQNQVERALIVNEVSTDVQSVQQITSKVSVD